MATTTSKTSVDAARSPERSVYRSTRPGPLRLVAEGFSDIWARRRLERYLVQADLKKKGSDTLLGNVWWVLDPLLQMVVYVVFVSILTANNKPDYPLFIFAAILPWKWFASSVNDATMSVVSQQQIIKQVKFPKIVLPVASVASGIANFAFGLIPLAALLLLLYRDRIAWTLLLIPAIAAVQFVFTLGFCVAVAAMNVFYRDVGNLLRHLLRLWFYLSPALYSADQLAHLSQSHPTVATVLALNPFSVIFESYHDVIYYSVMPNWAGLGILLAVSFGLLALAIMLFKRVEPAFAKIL
jgi:homopolymeric O-antigen transport system permease protein